MAAVGRRTAHQPAFQLQARTPDREFDLFAESVDEGLWQFRRDHRIHRDADELIVRSRSGIPVVRPEIQLLYMAKSSEPKNEHDFDSARPHLTPEAARWLAHALAITLPGHRWLTRLASTTEPKHAPTDEG